MHDFLKFFAFIYKFLDEEQLYNNKPLPLLPGIVPTFQTL